MCGRRGWKSRLAAHSNEVVLILKFDRRRTFTHFKISNENAEQITKKYIMNCVPPSRPPLERKHCKKSSAIYPLRCADDSWIDPLSMFSFGHTFPVERSYLSGETGRRTTHTPPPPPVKREVDHRITDRLSPPLRGFSSYHE